MVASDSTGRYTFSGVASRKWIVSYRTAGDGGLDVIPNEVASWRSLPFDVADGAGKEVPAFEVSHNGLLSPEDGLALVVGPDAVVPFHWSTHARAQRYRVAVTSSDKSYKWNSAWVAEPSIYYGDQVTPGSYYWEVEIDGGDSGQGVTRSRRLDLGP